MMRGGEIECAERDRLANEYDSLVWVLEKMVDTSATVSGEAREKALARIENQRVKCSAARERLNRHIAEHGC